MEHGEHANLPASLNMVHKFYNDSKAYLTATALKLNMAWTAGRKLQFETSQRNHTRRRQHTVNFKPGEEVDI